MPSLDLERSVDQYSGSVANDVINAVEALEYGTTLRLSCHENEWRK